MPNPAISYNKWTLTRDGEKEQVVVSGNLMSNDSDLPHRLAIKGKGIANKSLMDISRDLIDNQQNVALILHQISFHGSTYRLTSLTYQYQR